MGTNREGVLAGLALKGSALIVVVAVSLMATGCMSGRRYSSGALRFEKVNAGLMRMARDEDGCRYSYFHDSIYRIGARWHGAQYVSLFNGLILSVNVPGGSWLVYPFQYNDLTDEKHLFGVGSGESDLRYSLLWGFLSIGRNWNFLWLRGFWFGQGDPFFDAKAPEGTGDKLPIL